MDLFKKYTPNTYIERAYHYLRNSIFKVFICSILINTVFLFTKDFSDIKNLFDLLITGSTIVLLILILNLESYGVSKRKLLFILSELMNFDAYWFGFFINSSHKEIHLLTSAVATCGLQLLGNSILENVLIMLKLVFMWYIGPMLLGYHEFPTDKTPFLTLAFLLTVLSTVFTYRKNLEEEYAQAIDKIQKMKIQLSNIIQAMPDSMLIILESQEILLYNSACQQLFQADSSAQIQEKLATLKCSVNPGDSETSQTSLYDGILTYLHSEFTESIIFGINELNGHLNEWRGAKSEWEESKIVILTTRDITAIVSYEKAKDESKTILLRTISHEIRTPTNTIVNLSDSLLEELPDHDYIYKVKIINISSKLLLNLINDLLDFSRMVADCFSINKFEVKLKDFIKETYSLFAIQAEQKHLDFRFYIDPLLPEIIITDPNRLRQIIVNLMSNSMKFTLRGKILIEALLTEDSTMMIKVSDTGIGIPPNKIENLFSSFYKIQDHILNPQGCGLGLYISNKFSQILGKGPIHVTSRLHEGSVFYFDVDIGMQKKIIIESTEEELQEVYATEERYFETTPRNIITHDSFAPFRPEILIVDDNEFNLLVMRNFLDSASYEYEEARSGFEALEKVIRANATGAHLKVIIMDFQMPGMSGSETTKEISNLYKEKKIVYIPNIIGYTADDSEESIKLGQESGMKECLCKSSSKNAFLNIIKKYI